PRPLRLRRRPAGAVAGDGRRHPPGGEPVLLGAVPAGRGPAVFLQDQQADGIADRTRPGSAPRRPAGLSHPQDTPEDTMADREYTEAELKALADKAISRPLVTHIYTADPSAHVFEGKIYIYPSHDIETGAAFEDDGGHFQMRDYQVLCQVSPTSPARDCGVALSVDDVPWAD